MRDYSVICCAEPCPVPPNLCCMCSEIVGDYNVLYKRYSKVTTKCQNSRLQVLAKPKHCQRKYTEKCICSNVYSKVQLINVTDRQESTRTEQLALPKPRYISVLKQEKSFENFSDDRKSDVNRTLRKSLLSVYSRLMNVKNDQKYSSPKIIDQNVRNTLMENLEKLATPKKDFSIVKHRKSRADKRKTPSMKRIRKLSRPKTKPKYEPNQWVLTDALKHYRPTEHLLRMAKPKKQFEQEPIEVIHSNFFGFIGGSRTLKLALPHRNKSLKDVKIENPFKTKALALRAVASKRIIDLASPREYSDVHNRTNPFKISKGALKAKTSARIIKLAEPKKRKFI